MHSPGCQCRQRNPPPLNGIQIPHGRRHLDSEITGKSPEVILGVVQSAEILVLAVFARVLVGDRIRKSDPSWPLSWLTRCVLVYAPGRHRRRSPPHPVSAPRSGPGSVVPSPRLPRSTQLKKTHGGSGLPTPVLLMACPSRPDGDRMWSYAIDRYELAAAVLSGYLNAGIDVTT